MILAGWKIRGRVCSMIFEDVLCHKVRQKDRRFGSLI